MTTHSRARFLALTLPACLLLGAHTAVAQELWSSPSTWPSGQVPAEGEAVTIDSGKNIVLDVSPPTLRNLTINGKLSFADDKDIELKTDWIMLHGELSAGTEAQPRTRNATITLVDNVPGENANGMGDRGIMIMGGTLSLHGNTTHTWTKLASTAEAGSTTIDVLDASGWKTGDEIVLASTDYDFRQAERRTISAVSGNTITLDRPLEFMHFGEITFDVDERGEVGNLTRNIRIQASADSDSNYQGGHVMAMAGSKMFVSGVEFSRMGQHMQLARYPIHWHLLGDATGQFVKNSSFHDTFSRCVTVHGTNNLRVENNVTYNTVGHCFFLEDGVETGNWYVKNLGMLTKCHPTKDCVPTNLVVEASRPEGQDAPDVLLPSDNTVSTFWITNPNNHYVDNVAAGSGQIGFWIALPVNGIGQFDGTDAGKNTFPRRSPLGTFKGNVAHSNFDGMMFDRGPRPDNKFAVVGSNYHTARTDPTNPDSQRIESLIEDFTTYKNRNGGVWARGALHVFRNLKSADNGIGYTHAAGDLGGNVAFSSQVVDSLFVGETANIGNPQTEAEKAYGRSLPLPNGHADFPIRGYEYYDFRHDIVNTTFRNYEDNATRQAGAISYLLYTSFGISTENAVEKLTFENAKPVHFPARERRWAQDYGSSINYKGAVIHDKDGSLGGKPGSYVVIDNGIASDTEACEIKPEWNAAICEGEFGRVGIRKPGQGGGFGAPPAADAPPPPENPPITLVRNGREMTIGGGRGFGSEGGELTIRSGVDLKVLTENPALALSLREMEDGSSVIFELPGFTTANKGTELASLEALRNANTTSYYKGDDAMWVKLVVETANAAPGPGGGTNIEVSK